MCRLTGVVKLQGVHLNGAWDGAQPATKGVARKLVKPRQMGQGASSWGDAMIRSVSIFVALLAIVPAGICARADEAAGVSVIAAPVRPIPERHGASRLLNFDMLVRNNSQESYRVAKLEMSLYDAGHHLVTRRSLNTDAFSPSIALIGDRILTPGKTLDVFNPFSQFPADMPLDRLTYDFCLLREATPGQQEANRHRLPDDCDVLVTLAVVPRPYDDKTKLTLPVKGKVFVWEGHDFYAHHLRVPLGSNKVKAMGITANSNQFASDFIYADAQGRAFHGDPRALSNWYGYGKPVYAPGAGVVKEAEGDIPDNQFRDAKATAIAYPKLPDGKDPKDLGNHVLIDHGNGEFSLMLHMKPGSVTVKVGDHVRGGQQIGSLGFSGDAIFPHLHYVLMEGPETGKSWGLPAYFDHFRRYTGTAVTDVHHDTVNSGDFVESDAR